MAVVVSVMVLLGELRLDGLCAARTGQVKFHGELVRFGNVLRGRDEVAAHEREGLLGTVGPHGGG